MWPIEPWSKNWKCGMKMKRWDQFNSIVFVCVCVFSNGNYELKANLPSTTVFLPGTISKEIGNKNMSDSYVPSRYLHLFLG